MGVHLCVNPSALNFAQCRSSRQHAACAEHEYVLVADAVLPRTAARAPLVCHPHLRFSAPHDRGFRPRCVSICPLNPFPLLLFSVCPRGCWHPQKTWPRATTSWPRTTRTRLGARTRTRRTATTVRILPARVPCAAIQPDWCSWPRSSGAVRRVLARRHNPFGARWCRRPRGFGSVRLQSTPTHLAAAQTDVVLLRVAPALAGRRHADGERCGTRRDGQRDGRHGLRTREHGHGRGDDDGRRMMPRSRESVPNSRGMHVGTRARARLCTERCTGGGGGHPGARFALSINNYWPDPTSLR